MPPTYTDRELRLLAKALAVILVTVMPLALAWVGLSLRSQEKDRERIRRWLASHPGTYTVQINERNATDSMAIVAALKTIKHVPSHHSYPVELFRIEIISASESLELTLGRDSELPIEYWVFPGRPRISTEMGNDIGRITTSTLASYSGIPAAN
jgi:hypothetical protein